MKITGKNKCKEKQISRKVVSSTCVCEKERANFKNEMQRVT